MGVVNMLQLSSGESSSRSSGRVIFLTIWLFNAVQSGNIAGALIGQYLFTLQTSTEARLAPEIRVHINRDNFLLFWNCQNPNSTISSI